MSFRVGLIPIDPSVHCTLLIPIDAANSRLTPGPSTWTDYRRGLSSLTTFFCCALLGGVFGKMGHDVNCEREAVKNKAQCLHLYCLENNARINSLFRSDLSELHTKLQSTNDDYEKRVLAYIIKAKTDILQNLDNVGYLLQKKEFDVARRRTEKKE